MSDEKSLMGLLEELFNVKEQKIICLLGQKRDNLRFSILIVTGSEVHVFQLMQMKESLFEMVIWNVLNFLRPDAGELSENVSLNQTITNLILDS